MFRRFRASFCCKRQQNLEINLISNLWLAFFFLVSLFIQVCSYVSSGVGVEGGAAVLLRLYVMKLLIRLLCSLETVPMQDRNAYSRHRDAPSAGISAGTSNAVTPEAANELTFRFTSTRRSIISAFVSREGRRRDRCIHPHPGSREIIESRRHTANT